MQTGNLGALLRIALVGILAIGFWAIGKYENGMPSPSPVSAPASEFSAGRAENVLASVLGPEKPHPVSTDENAAVRARILDHYEALGIPAKTYTALGCRMSRYAPRLVCATTTDILAEVRQGTGRAIVMLSHYDSVPAGPGAADDESGTASILESARALKTDRDQGLHPILAVNTDSEEAGLLGAASFLDNPDFRARVGAVVNVEARGNRGPSLMFQTSPGDAPLIDLYAKSVKTYATSSLFEVIYRALPNDTDLTLFIERGFLSWNFAFVDQVAHYHTPLDTRAHLDPATLQMHGDNLLGMVRGLERTPYESLKGGDAIYISILGTFLPRLPAGWALPLSILAFALLLGGAFLSRNGSEPTHGWVGAFLILPALVIGAVLFGWFLFIIAGAAAGGQSPGYAHPAMLRAALGAGVLAVTLLVSRLAEPKTSARSIWIWIAGLAVVTAAFLTGLSPFYLFPLVVAVPVFLVADLAKIDLRSLAGRALVAVAALPMLLIWFALVANGESVGGLALHQLVTLTAAFAMVSLVPLIDAKAMSRNAWLSVSGGIAGLAIVLAVIAGLEPAYSAMAPQRLNIAYIEDATKNRATWSADAFAPLPPSLRAAADFSKKPEKPYPFAFIDAYVAPAGTAHFKPPTGVVSFTSPPFGPREVSIALHGSSDANQMFLVVPKSAGLKSIGVNNELFEVPDSWAQSSQDYALIGCVSRDCATKTIKLELASHGAVTIVLGEQRFSLPPEAGKLLAARPQTATPIQFGDTTVLINSVTLPGY